MKCKRDPSASKWLDVVLEEATMKVSMLADEEPMFTGDQDDVTT